MLENALNNVGVVVIGRNEGDRLKACIRSLVAFDICVVYVDSDSHDDSVVFVQDQGHDVVALDMSIPFSAARARNAGFDFLSKKYRKLQFVQFIDGDCELDAQWLSIAVSALKENGRLAAVCGRRKERYPEKSIYNMFCDIEWDTPIGLSSSTGGDFMCKVSAFKAVGGFTNDVVAGEEPELCFRLRQSGWLIERLDSPMTMHDANIFDIRSWWKRCIRTGHAFAQGYWMHGKSEEKYCRTEIIRIVKWNGLLLFACLSGLFVSSWFLVLLLFFPFKIFSLYFKYRRNLYSSVAFWYSVSLVVSKLAEAQGAFSFLSRRVSGRKFNIIEYKKNGGKE